MATRDELIMTVRDRYGRAGRSEKGRILDEFMAVTGFHVKHAMRVPPPSKTIVDRSRPPRPASGPARAPGWTPIPGHPHRSANPAGAADPIHSPRSGIARSRRWVTGRSPGRRAAILGELLRRPPDFPDRVRRTIERRIRHWQALHGPEQEVIFRQEHPPGQQELSDFTDPTALGLTIAGQAFRIGFTTSAWHSAAGATPKSWSGARASSPWPKACRTRSGPWAVRRSSIAPTSLSAAFRNLERDALEDPTQRYEALCAHYAMTPTRNGRQACLRIQVRCRRTQVPVFFGTR